MEGNETVSAVATGGKSFYGARLGLLVRRTRFPRLPGDPANARSFPFSLRYAVLERADRETALEAAERLLDEGAEGIGLAFNAEFDLADALAAPFAGGLAVQRSLVEAMLAPDAEVGALAFSGDNDRIAAPGYLADAVAADEDRLDVERARDSLLEAAMQAAADRPAIAAWLLEEPEMGPFASDIHAATARPVYDRTRFLAWFHASLAPRVFPR